MRALTLFLLTLCLSSPALAQMEMIRPPAPAAAPVAANPTAPAGTSTAPAAASTKIQIGYDKRADYRTIKQPLSGRPAKPEETATPIAPTNTAQNKNIRNTPTGAASLDATKKAMPAVNTPATQAAAAAAAVPAAPTKPRSDSALKSDNSPARAAAAAAQAEAATKAAADKEKAEAIGTAIAAAQRAGAVPVGALPALPTTR